MILHVAGIFVPAHLCQGGLTIGDAFGAAHAE